MYKITFREDLTPRTHHFKVKAPEVAAKAAAGQFVVVRVDEKGERIPLTIADWDRDAGTVSIVFNEVGTTTHKLSALKKGDSIANFAGPLGLATEIDRFGTVVCVAGGYGVATIVPVARALKAAGNKVISIMRAPTKELVFGEERLRAVSDQLSVVVGDGSYGLEGIVVEPLRDLLHSGQKVDRVIVFAALCMMKYCAEATRPFGVKTMVSLNPVMVDGTGMCGCCRVCVGGKTRFACVHGPEFDGHGVDWSLLMSRRCTYGDEPNKILQYRCGSCAQW